MTMKDTKKDTEIIYEDFTIKEIEEVMRNKEGFKKLLRQMEILYGNWDLINEDDEAMCDHLYEVLYFFGVKNLGAKNSHTFASLRDLDIQRKKWGKDKGINKEPEARF